VQGFYHRAEWVTSRKLGQPKSTEVKRLRHVSKMSAARHVRAIDHLASFGENPAPVAITLPSIVTEFKFQSKAARRLF